MPNYRRYRVAGGTYFFTLALADRRSDLLVQEVTALRAAVSRVRALHPFRIDAWVVLSDRLHAVWTLPDGDADFSTRWTLIKRGFSARMAKDEIQSASRTAKESAESGSGDFGNTRYVMMAILHGMSITSISTLSSMASSPTPGIGRSPPFGAWWHAEITQPTGETAKWLLASTEKDRKGEADESGRALRSTPPLLKTVGNPLEMHNDRENIFLGPRWQITLKSKTCG